MLRPAQRDQLAPAHSGQSGDQDQGSVAGGGGAAGTALAQQRGAGQIVVVDGGIEDGAKQRQVRCSPSAQRMIMMGKMPGRALVDAVLVADLVALVGVAGRGWDNRHPGHYHASVSQVTDDSRPARRMSSL